MLETNVLLRVWQVTEEDLGRVAAATGAQVQTTVNNLNPKVLGTCAQFDEQQVGAFLSMLYCSVMRMPLVSAARLGLILPELEGLKPSPAWHTAQQPCITRWHRVVSVCRLLQVMSTSELAAVS